MLQIKSYIELQYAEKQLVYHHLYESSLFSNELEMHVYLTSSSFHGGLEALTFWQGQLCLACIAISTKYVALKGDAYVPFCWVASSCAPSEAAYIIAKAVSYCSSYTPKRIHLLNPMVQQDGHPWLESLMHHGFISSNEVWTFIHRNPHKLMLKLEQIYNPFERQPLNKLLMPDFLELYNRIFHYNPWVWPLERKDLEQRFDEQKNIVPHADLLYISDRASALLEVEMNDHIGWIETIAIIQEQRGKGLAKALLYEAVKKLLAFGAAELRLRVLHDNQRAIQLYQQAGFEPLLCNGLWYSYTLPTQAQLSKTKKSRRVRG